MLQHQGTVKGALNKSIMASVMASGHLLDDLPQNKNQSL